MKVPDWQQREAPARDGEQMNAQAKPEQHPGTPDSQGEWGTGDKKEFAAENNTHVNFRRS